MSKTIFKILSGKAAFSGINGALKFVMIAMSAVLFLTAQADAARYAGIVVDAKSGKVLYSEDPDGLRYPASLTKMMTLYLVFEALDQGRISKNTIVTMSAHAASQAPSKLGVRAGGQFTVEQGILALVTRSANDCSVALGELLGGSEARFARMMTAKAHALGMTRTEYRNANGLPNDAQVTTARDQARLGIALRQHFPQYYGYFSTRSFKFGRQIIGNHNRLLGKVRGVDGIKTGYTQKAGFNLVTSAQADGRSIVGVVLGAKSGGARNAQMTALVNKYLQSATTKGGNVMAAVAPTPVEPVITKPAASVAASAAAQADVPQSADDGDIVLPKTGPVPSARYTVEEIAAAISPKDALPGEETPVVNTAIYSDPQPVVEEAQSEDATPPSDDSQADLKRQVKQKVGTVPQLIPPADVDLAPAKVDKQITASTTKDPKGWVIQIGVGSDKAKAQELLQNAQDNGGKVLRSANPFTVPFESGKTRMYRARFGGFDNQEAAVKACKVLKAKKINCWASLQ